MNDWMAELRRGQEERAWDRFLDGYRGLLFAAIRHYAREYDDVMDVFTYVCDELRADDSGNCARTSTRSSTALDSRPGSSRSSIT